MLRTEGVYSGSSNRLFKSFKTGLIKQTLEWGFGKIHLKGNMWGGGDL